MKAPRNCIEGYRHRQGHGQLRPAKRGLFRLTEQVKKLVIALLGGTLAGTDSRLQITQSKFATTLSPLLQAAGQRVGRRPPRRSIVNPAGAGQRDGGGVLGDGQGVGMCDHEKSGGWSHQT